ncbi:hypothetical protein LINPERHAP2_LOCUS10796 [Linum perenne]
MRMRSSTIDVAVAMIILAGAAEKENDGRSWNLKTRRAVCKAPATTPKTSIGASPATGKGLRIEEQKDSSYTPMRFDLWEIDERG